MGELMDIATYTLYLDFGSGWEDFTEKILLQEGYVPRVCIGKEGRHEIQTVKVKLQRSAGISARLTQKDDDIPAKLLRDGQLVMTGIVRPYNTSRAVLNRMDPVSLSIMDRSATLEQYVFETKLWTGLSVVDRTDTAKSLIHILFAEAGVENSDILVDFDREESIPYYALSNGEYISDRIQEALYEYGLTYRATVDGKFRILDISTDTIIPGLTLHTTDIRTEFSLARSDNSQKGSIVKWYPVLTKAGAAIFESDIADGGETIASGGVFPSGSDTEGYRLPYDISEYAGTGKLLAIANPALSYTPSSLQVLLYTDFGTDDCSAYLKSNATGTQTITDFKVIADIWYKGSSYSQQIVPGTKPKTYTAKVISDALSALRLARILASRQTFGQQSYGFDSGTVMDPGLVVRVIEDKVSYLDVNLRILSREFDVATGLYRYTAEGISEIDLTTTVERIDMVENALGKPRKGATGDTGSIGPRGLQGLQGEKGDQGIQGVAGADGLTAYSHIAYADDASGGGFSQFPSGKTYIGFYADHTAADSSSPSLYAWSLIKGADGSQGIQGPTGADGLTSYFHTAWSNSSDGSVGFSTTVSSGKLYIGVYSDHTAADSTTYASYSWTLVKGDKGDTGATGPQGIQGLQGPTGSQGIQGPTGADGLAAYNHIAYADDASGGGFSQFPSGKTYIGFYADHTAADSSSPSLYAWSLIKGADGSQGIQGPTGADGLTSYFHTAWSNSSDGSVGFSTTVSTGKLYIGVYSDHSTADSSNYAAYSWTLIKGDKGDTGSPGATGESARDFTVFVSPTTFSLSSRGKVLAAQSVTLYCNKLNIGDEVSVSWASDEDISLSSALDSPVTAIIPEGSTLESFSVSCTVVGFGSKAVTIPGVKNGEAKPLYLGVCAIAPTETSEGPLMGSQVDGGDFYLDTDNIPHWYNGSSWNPVDGNTPNYSQIMASVAGDVIASKTTVPVTSACYGYFKNLSAVDAFLDSLRTRVIKLLSTGKIESDVYEKGVTGFQLLADGTFNAVNASLVSGLFTGLITSDPLTTTTASEAGTAITFDSKTHWLLDEIYSLVPLTESTALQTIAGAYQGKSFTKATKLASGATAIISSATISGSKHGNGYTTVGSTTVPSGSSSFTYSVSVRSSSSKAYGYAKLIVGGSTVATWQAKSTTYVTYTGTLTRSAGTTISVQVQGGDYSISTGDSVDAYGYVSAAFSFMSTLTGKGIFLGYSDGSYGLIGTGVYGNSLTMTGYTPVYNYAKPTAFISGVSSYALNELKAASGTVTLDSEPYTVVGVMRTSGGMSIFHTDGALAFQPGSDPGTYGYYNCTGSYAVIASVVGAEMMNINAKETDVYSIGTIKRFLNIIGKNGIFSNVTIGNSNLGTNGYAMLPNGLHIEWGYVTCSNYGQVHTTSPAYFNVPFTGTHTYWAGVTAGDDTSTNGLFSVGINNRYIGSMTIASYGVNSTTSREWMHWVAIGY
jgi:hypothetical protein